MHLHVSGTTPSGFTRAPAARKIGARHLLPSFLRRRTPQLSSPLCFGTSERNVLEEIPMSRSLVLISVLLFAAQVSATQRLGSGSVEGIVVRWGAGDPLSEVDVELARIEGTSAFPLGSLTYPPGEMSPGLILRPTYPNPSDLLRTRTTSDGKFSFPSLPPGTYRLLAAKAGGMYHPAEYGQYHPRGRGYNFPLSDGQVMRGVRLEMAATGSISGRIVDEDGSPAARAQVLLFESSWQSGRARLGLKQSAVTDDRGEYRLYFLPPGRYFIGARSEDLRKRTTSFRRYGQDAGTETLAEASVVMRTNESGQPVEETFVTVYYGGNTDPSSARPVIVASGTAVNGADILLTAGQPRAFRIRGSIVDANGAPAPQVAVRAIPHIWSPSIIAPGISSDAEGKFEIVGMPPGVYAIRGSGSAAGVSLNAISHVEVRDANVEGVRLVLNAGATTTGTIILEGRAASAQSPDISTLRVRLVPDHPMFPAGTGGAVTGNSFTVTGIHLGDYRVSVNPLDRVASGPPYSPLPAIPPALQNVYVKSVRMGGEDVLERGVHLAGQPPREIEVVLGINGGIVQGTVIDQRQQIVPNAVIALVPPPTLRSRIDLFRSALSDINGKFRLIGLAPGEYRIFAWKYVEEGRWYDPQFLSTVDTRARSLRVSEGGTETIELPVLPEEP